MKNILSYYGLVNARIITSEKDLPVLKIVVSREDEASNRNVKRTSKEWYTRLG